MSRINHHLEEFLIDLLVDPSDYLGRLGRIGEVLELHPTQKFKMPRFDGAFGEPTLLVAAGMHLDQLLDPRIKGLALELLTSEPFFEGG